MVGDLAERNNSTRRMMILLRPERYLAAGYLYYLYFLEAIHWGRVHS